MTRPRYHKASFIICLSLLTLDPDCLQYQITLFFFRLTFGSKSPSSSKPLPLYRISNYIDMDPPGLAHRSHQVPSVSIGWPQATSPPAVDLLRAERSGRRPWGNGALVMKHHGSEPSKLVVNRSHELCGFCWMIRNKIVGQKNGVRVTVNCGDGCWVNALIKKDQPLWRGCLFW